MFEWLHWLVQNYIIDLWTFVHLGVFTCMGTIVVSQFHDSFENEGKTTTLVVYFSFCLYLTVIWEVYEKYLLEPAFDFHEPDLNRFVSDPLANVTGALLGIWLSKKVAKKML
jgi:hypothetical protein